MPQPETIQLATRALTSDDIGSYNANSAEHSAGILPSNTRNETSLAPVDKGLGAWSFVRHSNSAYLCQLWLTLSS